MSEQSPHSKRIGNLLWKTLIVVAIVLLVGGLVYSKVFGPTDTQAQPQEIFVQEDESVSDVARELTQKGFVRNEWVFQVAYLRESYGHTIRPGGYQISKSMDAWTIASVLTSPPYLAWVKIPVGVRKEQIANILSSALGWDENQKKAWLVATETAGKDYVEGVYFPDTYFIPTTLGPAQVAGTIRSHFQTVFQPYAQEAVTKHMSWPTVLTIASLIEREAGSIEDMPIISGIIQKRLASGMPLAIDATLQYMANTQETGWWAPPAKAGTYANSPFNTYKNKGLPPHPIAEPGLSAIEAALNPIPTKCVFYIHDTHGKLHCSPTYKGQLSNISKFLK